MGLGEQSQDPGEGRQEEDEETDAVEGLLECPFLG